MLGLEKQTLSCSCRAGGEVGIVVLACRAPGVHGTCGCSTVPHARGKQGAAVMEEQEKHSVQGEISTGYFFFHPLRYG